MSAGCVALSPKSFGSWTGLSAGRGREGREAVEGRDPRVVTASVTNQDVGEEFEELGKDATVIPDQVRVRRQHTSLPREKLTAQLVQTPAKEVTVLNQQVGEID
jgi:hypothetical protein